MFIFKESIAQKSRFVKIIVYKNEQKYILSIKKTPIQEFFLIQTQLEY